MNLGRSNKAYGIQVGDIRRLKIADPAEAVETNRERHTNLIAARDALSDRHELLSLALAAAWTERAEAMAAGAPTAFVAGAKPDELAEILNRRAEAAAIEVELADVSHAVALSADELRLAEKAAASGGEQE